MENKDQFFEWLSSWKKWNNKLGELIKIHWADKVSKIRSKLKTPWEVEEILSKK